MSKPRVSPQQREAMLAFMMAHEDLARGRVTGPDAVRHKAKLLQEMTTTLNSIGSGATKTPDKWLKCWMDWRCDVKAKALKIKKYCEGSGGGPGPSPLTQIEETLLQFCGIEMVLGVEDVQDPLEVTDMIPPTEVNEKITDPSAYVEVEVIDEGLGERHHKAKNSLDRQAIALEHVAGGLAEVASSIKLGLQEVAAALRAVATAVEQQNMTAMAEDD
ncbi:uncharacterized protein LOC113227829 isoform X2 [Hyposmocoma kahamanoa]|uniref:uncharacterized protein LOC113227829 isoform X2 n=1 Tax=Hyposmocoma kahamanoa TaxID=1477025 RepID=UPI000E6D9432|nr:uncharacterized protein LOC113227829 isoform X2 [Hyposmocoma kahamanoa]